MNLLNKLRDWWRGYSDADIKTAQHKLNHSKPMEYVWLSRREYRAVTRLGLGRFL